MTPSRTHRRSIHQSVVVAAGALFVCLVGVVTASAATIYDANIPRKFLPSDSDPLYYQVGPFSGPGRIMYDDVPVNYSSAAPVNPSVNVTRLSFDISRLALAPSV